MKRNVRTKKEIFIFSLVLVLSFCIGETLFLRNGSIVIEDTKITKFIRGLLILDINLLNNDIEEAIKDLENHKDKWPNELWESDTLNKSSSVKLQNSFQNKFENQIAYLKEIHCKQFIAKKRTKRGLLNIGGTILKEIFGVATTEDTDSINTEIKEHIKITTQTITEVYKTSDHLKETMLQMATLMNNLTRLSNINNAIINIEFLYDTIVETCSNYNNLIVDAKLGKVQLSSFNRKTIEDEITRARLNWALEPVVHLQDAKFEDSLITKVIDNSQQTNIIIAIPFSDKKLYKQIEIQPLPMFNNEDKDRKYQIDIENKNCILSLDNSKIGFVSDAFIEHCHQAADIQMCPNILELKTKSIGKSICELNIIRWNTTNNCHYSAVSAPKIVSILTDDFVIISGIPDEYINVECNKTFEVFQIPKSGLVKVGKNCHIESETLEFIPTKIKKSKLSYEGPSRLSNDFIVNEKIEGDITILLKTLNRSNVYEKNSFFSSDHSTAVITSTSMSSIVIIFIVVIGSHKLWRIFLYKKKRSTEITHKSDIKMDEMCVNVGY